MKVIFSILAIIVGLTQASSILPKDTLAQLLGHSIDVETLRQARADASGYFDEVLANLREQMYLQGLDSIPLPDNVLEFEQVIGGINWHGTAALYNGSLLNLDTLHRTGVADISVEENGDLVIKAEVGINQGTIHYEMLAQFMDLGPHAIVDGTLSRVRLLMALRVDFSSMVVHMETFDIKSTGVLSIDIKGLGIILNFLVGIVAEFLGNLIKGIVASLLEGTIKNIINKILADLFFPPTVFAAISVVQEIVGASLM